MKKGTRKGLLCISYTHNYSFFLIIWLLTFLIKFNLGQSISDPLKSHEVRMLLGAESNTKPSSQPTGQPTRQPIMQPFRLPSAQPSSQPTGISYQLNLKIT
jgi:hypothetical protein